MSAAPVKKLRITTLAQRDHKVSSNNALKQPTPRMRTIRPLKSHFYIRETPKTTFVMEIVHKRANPYDGRQKWQV